VKPGVELLEDAPGVGAPPWGLYDRARIEDGGTTLFTSLRVDREYMFAGLFYGVIPPNALLTVEIHVVAERAAV
jgi:hypothetical protein